KLERKIREAILAYRLEKALSKVEILYLYLNNVYLGHHSYGVQSAAENYFRKDVRDLTLAEMALIGGLPQAPTRYSPFVPPQESMLDGLLAVDKRQGFRGPAMHLDGAEARGAFLQKSQEAMGTDPVKEGKYYVALVTSVEKDGKWADVRVGEHKGVIPVMGARW